MHNIRHLSYIVKIAELGSLTKAAEEFRLSPPALTSAVRGYETRFGSKLFIKTPKDGLTPTYMGRRFVDGARKLLAGVEEFEREIFGIQNELAGQLEVGCYAYCAPVVLPDIINAMTCKYPGASVGIHEGSLDQVIGWLRTGIVDIAVTYDLFVGPSVKFETLATLSPFAILPANAPLAKKKIISLNDLKNLPIIVLEVSGVQEYFHNFLTTHNISPKTKYRTKTFEMVRSLIGSGGGYSLGLTNWKSSETADGGQVVNVPLKEKAPKARVVLAFRNAADSSPLINAFAEVCRDYFLKNYPTSE